MAETFEHNGKRITIIDLSQSLSNETSGFEPLPHRIEYSDHVQSVKMAERLFGLGAEFCPGGLAWAAETVTLSTHSGTHVDAPYHYGPLSGGRPARTIDQVPLRWCFGDGVLLNMTHKKRGEGITAADVEAELRRIGYTIKPFDIVLVRTDTWKHFGEPGYDLMHPGLRRSAVEWLVSRGVKVIGIDAWGLDRPFDVMAEEARRGDKSVVWEAHIFGREHEYLQIEKLCHLDEIPVPFGFKVFAFPVKLHRASGGWARVVAVLEEDLGR